MNTAKKMVRVELGGDVRVVPEAEWQAAADELHAKHGGMPRVTHEPDAAAPVPEAAPAPAPAPAARPGGLRLVSPLPMPGSVSARPERGEAPVGGQFDIIGAARSEIDKAAAIAAGFAPAHTVYERGTRVIEVGVQAAISKRAEWEAMPLTGDACLDLIEVIRREERYDRIAQATLVEMTDAGALRAEGGEARPLCERAFPGLLARLGIGGTNYLTKCWPALRAHNINEWIGNRRQREGEIAALPPARGKRPEALELKMRERKTESGEEVFAVVSPGYAAFDADKILEAIRRADVDGARGRVTYDGFRTRVEVLFHSTVQPEHYVAGEFFRAGVIIDTDDTGSGAIDGSAVVWQNLCLNLAIIDEDGQPIFKLRHVGDVDTLAEKFREGFKTAMGRIEHFRAAWDRACDENVVTRARGVSEEELPVRIEDVMPGIFNGILEREMVPVYAAREVAVPRLMQMWTEDESGARGPTRAAVVNAFTRYAHRGVTGIDAWQEDNIQRAAGALLNTGGKRPAPLPYLPFFKD